MQQETKKKTYTETITRERPCLEVWHDDSTESPREWDNLGYFIAVDRNYYSPDRHPEFERIIKETGDEATDQADHMERIKKEIEEQGEKILAIYPVGKYEHSGVCYYLGTRHGFDYSNNGFYIVTKKSAEIIGAKKKDFEDIIRAEIKTFNSYMNGEVYGYTLYDEAGELIDSCGGFYSLNDIRESLPEEYKNEDLSEYMRD